MRAPRSWSRLATRCRPARRMNRVGEAVDRSEGVEPLRVQPPVAEGLVVADVDDGAGGGLDVEHQVTADGALEVGDQVGALPRRQGGEPRRGHDGRGPSPGESLDVVEELVGEAEVHLHLHEPGVVQVVLDPRAVKRHGAGVDDARRPVVAPGEGRDVPRGEHAAVESFPGGAHLARLQPTGEAVLPHLPALGIAAQVAVLGVADVEVVEEGVGAMGRVGADLPGGVADDQRVEARDQRRQGRRHRAGGAVEGTVDAHGQGVAALRQQSADVVAVVEVAVVGAAGRPRAEVAAVEVRRVARVGGDEQGRRRRNPGHREAAAGEKGAVPRLRPRHGDPPRFCEDRLRLRVGLHPQPPAASRSSWTRAMAAATAGGFMGRSSMRAPVAAYTALATAARGGTIGTSPTPRTP